MNDDRFAELELRKAELALRESEARYRTLFNSIDEGFCIIQFLDGPHGPLSDYIHIEANPAYADHAGIPNVVGQKLREMVPDEADDWIARYQPVLVTGKPVRFEQELVATGRWLELAAFRVEPAEKRQVAVLFTDITERRRAEEAVRSTNRFNQEIIDSLSEHLAVLDKDGVITLVNNAWRRFATDNGADWSTENVGVGANYLNVCRQAADKDEDAKAVERGITEVLDGTRSFFSIEYPCHSPDAKRWFLLTATPLSETRGAVITHLNVTERRLAELEVRESEKRLQLIMESVDDYAIITTDPAGVITNWNRGAEKMFGYDRSEVIGLSKELIFTPEDRAAGVPAKELEAARRDGKAEDERVHIRKDGSRFHLSGVLTRLQDGLARGFVKIARDMTEKNRLEAEQREKEILERLLQAQEEERRRIARDLHDDLGQQLTALRLKLENLAGLTANNDGVLAEIEAARALALGIDRGVDFLAWELRPVAVSDTGLVEALSTYVEQWSGYSGIPAEISPSRLENERLDADVETNLYRIAQEALNNIQKHSGAKEVMVSLDRRDGEIVLVVADDGRGFDPQASARPVTGIGLVGMSERAELLGGSFEVESRPGDGTTVYVRVPHGH